MNLGIRPTTSLPTNLHAGNPLTSIWNTRTVVVLCGLALVGSISIWIYRYFTQPAPRDVPTLDIKNISWEELSQELHLPPKEGSKTYEQQVQDFYQQFGQFIDQASSPKTTEGPGHFIAELLINSVIYFVKTKIMNTTPQAIYEEFMTSLKKESQPKRSEAVSMALEHGFLDVAFHFTQTDIINQKENWIDREKVLSKAGQQKQWYMVNKLLEQSSNQADLIRTANRSFVLCQAAEDGQLDIVKLVLKKGLIPENWLGIAFCRAAKIGRLDIMKAVFENDTIPRYCRFWAACNAQVKNYEDIIREMGPPESCKEDIAKAIISACHDNHLELVTYLLQMDEISQEDREKALQIAQEKGFEDIAQLLTKK